MKKKRQEKIAPFGRPGYGLVSSGLNANVKGIITDLYSTEWKLSSTGPTSMATTCSDKDSENRTLIKRLHIHCDFNKAERKLTCLTCRTEVDSFSLLGIQHVRWGILLFSSHDLWESPFKLIKRDRRRCTTLSTKLATITSSSVYSSSEHIQEFKVKDPY